MCANWLEFHLNYANTRKQTPNNPVLSLFMPVFMVFTLNNGLKRQVKGLAKPCEGLPEPSEAFIKP